MIDITKQQTNHKFQKKNSHATKATVINKANAGPVHFSTEGQVSVFQHNRLTQKWQLFSGFPIFKVS